MPESSETMSPSGAGLYIHIPFCLSKCSYCSFNSYPLAGQNPEGYVAALFKQMEVMAEHPWCRNQTFCSLYIGGGTPTALKNKDLVAIIEKCLHSYHFVSDPEITVETNPNTVDTETLSTLYLAGVNRLSIGVQSFSDRLLQEIDRSHSSEEALRAIEYARQGGFSNINIDLIYGLPTQTLDDWKESLKTAVSLGLQHVSIYELMVEENTPLAGKVAENSTLLPTEEEVADMEEITAEMVSSDFQRYEISNFCRKGFACRHNILYWQNRSYLGLGAGAVSGLRGLRICNIADPALYAQTVNNNELPIASIECLCRKARFRETVIMGLRMVSGISIAELKERFDLTPEEYYGETLLELMGQNLLETHEGSLRLTSTAFPVANQVLADLV
ncbi:MAG: radical SAM family heme chaperone HemW [Desulfovibrionaceae bacterium]|nr:radical SAM family heme chaperone HemW [Desulfovibrionaceae bacterium]